MTSDRDDRGSTATADPPWHNRTGTLIGASVAAVIGLALLYFLISTMVREFNEPPPAPQYFLEPTGSGTSQYRSSTSSTTSTITSTSPPVTSDFNSGDPTSTTSGTDTSTSTEPGTTRPPRTRDDDAPSTTRSRPRLNETRTLYPRP